MRVQRQDASSARSIYALPDDVLLLVVSHINVKDIISLRKVSFIPCFDVSTHLIVTDLKEVP